MAEELQQPEEGQPEPERASSPEQRFTPPRRLREGEKWTMDEVLDWLNTQTWETGDSTAFIRRMRDASRPDRQGIGWDGTPALREGFMAEEIAQPEEGQPEPERGSTPEQSSAPPWPQNGEKWTVEESIAWLETQTWQSETDSTAFIRRMRDASRPDRQPEPEKVSSPEQRFTPPRQLREGEKWTMDEVLDWLNTQTWQSETDSTAFIRRMRDASR